MLLRSTTYIVYGSIIHDSNTTEDKNI